MTLRFVVPADVDTPTGGNVYDLAVARALGQINLPVELVRCELSGLGEILADPWQGPTLVDGILACQQPQAVASRRIGVLVHMPLALESGLPSDRASEFDRLEKEALHAAELVVATSHWAAQHLTQHHGLGDVAVAEPGVELAPVSMGSDPRLIVHLAALLPHKDQLGVVAALSGVNDLPWRATLAGAADRDPAYAAAVREAVISADLTDRIAIPGMVSRDAAWAGADLALLPSRAETFGMVVTEALARGIPVVVSAGGAAEALGFDSQGERPGAVIPAADPAALTRVLRRWLTDQAYSETLRQSALSRRDTLEGWDTTARRLRLALTRLR